MTFGLITEGPTDQVVIKTILARYFSDPNIDTRPVQPNIDSTDIKDHFGGWKNVFNYCGSTDMAAALEVYNYIVIQVDTDTCEEYGVNKREGSIDITDEEIIIKTKKAIIACIDEELYSIHSEKIIFAISVESIECWLLPLYYNDNKRNKTINCCDTLNQELSKKGFTIDCNNKRAKEYNLICKKIKNKVIVESISKHNNGFNQFIQQLAQITT